MMSDGRGGSVKSDFISKGSLIKHLMREGGGLKKGTNHPTSYMDGPLNLLKKIFLTVTYFGTLFQ